MKEETNLSHPVEIDPILLSKVSKPARYVGGEWNSVVKDHDAVKLTVAYCFPDVYEVAMSHLGLRILYALLNERPDVAAERVYAPWPDMEEVMRSQGYPLFSLETKTPVRDFDMVGFTLQYEMSFTNILNMLDLAGIDPDYYAARTRSLDEALPWDHLSNGAAKAYLKREWQKATVAELTHDCRRLPCTGCGVCPHLGVSIIDRKEGDDHGKTTFSC